MTRNDARNAWETYVCTPTMRGRETETVKCAMTRAENYGGNARKRGNLMSLLIDVDTVTSVLLADRWHAVESATFELDSYEFAWSGRTGVKVEDLDPDDDPVLVHGGGQSGVCATGFRFASDDGSIVSGPLTSILAVRY